MVDSDDDTRTQMLEDRVAIVTGAGQGVGQGIAFSLARHGAKVAVMGRTFSKVQTTAQLIEKRGGVALPLEGDVKSHILNVFLQIFLDEVISLNT